MNIKISLQLQLINLQYHLQLPFGGVQIIIQNPNLLQTFKNTMSQSELEQLQRSLRAILQDQSDPKPLRIPHIRDIESFYKNESEDKKKVLCRYYNNNKCTKGIHCPYSHDKELLRQQRFKIQLCKNFEQTGSCKFKDNCTFAHGRAQLRYNK